MKVSSALEISNCNFEKNDQYLKEKELSLFDDNIDRLHSVSYDYFCTHYMKLNKPCIFTENLTKKWKSRNKWVTDDGNLNSDYLIRKFGSSNVPVVMCDDKNINCDHKEIKFKTYVEQYIKNNTDNSLQAKPLYLKDWHFNRTYSNYTAYVTPEYFSEDWLNESCKYDNDDFQFIYIGPKGTWTPLHADVYGSYSWSANICGRKRWLLFPPGQEELLKDSSRKLPFMLKMEDLSSYKNVKYLDVIQKAGEVIFVPSGWYHQVWNIETTISINHNWFNGYNILHIWSCLMIASSDVEKELSDLKECENWWSEHQFLLKAHHGMNLHEFFKILEFIYESRTASEPYSKTQQLFDIQAIQKVLTRMRSASMPKDLFAKLEKLLKTVTHFIDNCK